MISTVPARLGGVNSLGAMIFGLVKVGSSLKKKSSSSSSASGAASSSEDGFFCFLFCLSLPFLFEDERCGKGMWVGPSVRSGSIEQKNLSSICWLVRMFRSWSVIPAPVDDEYLNIGR